MKQLKFRSGKLELDIDEIESQIALKKIDRVMALAKEVLKFYECERCGKCCRIPIHLRDEEVERFLAIEGEAFLNKLNPDEVLNYLRIPCPYLADGICTIYDESYRPEVYPFTASSLIPSMALCPLGEKIADDFIPLVERLRGHKISRNPSPEEQEVSQLLEDLHAFGNLRDPINLMEVKPDYRLVIKEGELEKFLKYLRGKQR